MGMKVFGVVLSYQGEHSNIKSPKIGKGSYAQCLTQRGSAWGFFAFLPSV